MRFFRFLKVRSTQCQRLGLFYPRMRCFSQSIFSGRIPAVLLANSSESSSPSIKFICGEPTNPATKSVLRIIINLFRSVNLLNLSLVQNDNPVPHCQSLCLVVGYIDKCCLQFFVQFFLFLPSSVHEAWHQGLKVVHPSKILLDFLQLPFPEQLSGAVRLTTVLVYGLSILSNQEFQQLPELFLNFCFINFFSFLSRKQYFLLQSYADIVHNSGKQRLCPYLLAEYY